MSERVVVAMSGGVDSSVAAALLVEQGFDVIGVTLRLVGDASRCCSLDDAEDARRVAERLGIRFYVADYADAFRREVMEPFADSYLAGRTPIPCVGCNQRFKFRHLLERSRALGAAAVATGHYARIERDPTSGALALLRGSDPRKDQSYFLFDLRPEQLAQIRFPVGALAKNEVRARARALGLATADKPESQELCFVPDGNTAAAVERLRPGRAPGAGEVVDEAGRVRRASRRASIISRSASGAGSRSRWASGVYVKTIDATHNRVTVAPGNALGARGARLGGVSWVAGAAPDAPLRATVRIRHRHAGAKASVEALTSASARVLFDEPVAAVTPGQAAVFYDGDAVLGGGWIEEALP